MTHANVTTTGRYVRRRAKTIANIAEGSKQSRPVDDGRASSVAVQAASGTR
jgi:hypothetical protein